MVDIQHEVNFGLPDGQYLVGLVLLSIDDRGVLHAAASPTTNFEHLPPATPWALRWLADALDIDSINEVTR